MRIEKVVHKLGMVLTYAEAKRPTLADIQQNFVHFLQYQIGADMIARKDIIQLRFIITAVAPFQGAQVHRIGNSEILKRRQKFAD